MLPNVLHAITNCIKHDMLNSAVPHLYSTQLFLLDNYSLDTNNFLLFTRATI